MGFFYGGLVTLKPICEGGGTLNQAYCPYCGSHKPEEEFTDEHFLAESLGSPATFTIRVCKKCNGDAGSSIDAALIDNYFISLERVLRGLKGQSNQLPEFEFKGTVDIEGQNVPAMYSFSTEKKRMWVKPEVKKRIEGEKELYEIECSEDDLERILKDIKSKLKKRGLGNRPIKEEQKRVVSIPTPNMRVGFGFDITSMQRGMVKIGLGLGHLVLGESWTSSKDGDLFRQFIWEPDPDKREGILHGSTWPQEIDQKFTKILSHKDWHLLAVMNRNPLSFYCNLFGKYAGCALYYDGVWPLQGKESGGVVFLIDPVQRRKFRYGFDEFFGKKEGGTLP
ncbi:HNH endonuclease [bacterium]|nr:HNH endonuclease [bacterium]